MSVSDLFEDCGGCSVAVGQALCPLLEAYCRRSIALYRTSRPTHAVVTGRTAGGVRAIHSTNTGFLAAIAAASAGQPRIACSPIGGAAQVAAIASVGSAARSLDVGGCPAQRPRRAFQRIKAVRFVGVGDPGAGVGPQVARAPTLCIGACGATRSALGLASCNGR